MSPWKWSITLIGATSAVLGFIYFAVSSNNGILQTTSRQQMRPQAQGVTLAPAPATALASPQRAVPVAAMSYKAAFQTSINYWTFAREILPAAKAGNAEAQFYLSRALERCDEDNRMYFQHRGQKLSLDEGLQFAVKRHLPIEVAQSVFDKCHEFMVGDSTEFGSAPDWLSKATAAGQPLAEATTAGKILMQDLRANFAKAGGVPDPSTTAKIGNGADPRELLYAAVKSKDPEVLFSIGDAQGMLHPSNSDTNTTRFAWWLVACQRGLDCSAGADWVKNTCAGDPQCASANGPSDLVRNLAGDKWPDVQQRAQEINAKLDAGQWDELDLGS